MTFETAFTRLEDILQKLNSGTLPLDQSLQLYEEADALIVKCSKKLTEAEKKVEMLIKARTGELEEEEGAPKTEPFSPKNEAY